MSAAAFPLLSQIASPKDVRALDTAQLGDLCGELREFLIRTVATRGGHFAAFEEPELFLADLTEFCREFR